MVGSRGEQLSLAKKSELRTEAENAGIQTLSPLGLWCEIVWPGTAGTTRRELETPGHPLDPVVKEM